MTEAEINQNPQVASSMEQIETEMNDYLKQPLVKGITDPLEFWKTASANFPLLATCARSYLSVQAKNCSSERVNSVGGQIITDRRHNLSKQSAETLIWCKKNKDFLF